MNSPRSGGGMNSPRVALVLGTSTGGVGVHVLSLARALDGAGWGVTVCAPASTQAVFDFGSAGARVETVPIGGAGRELFAVRSLRRAIADADLIHAHGLRAGTVAGLARRHPLVVTWHNAVLARGASGRLMALGERFVARAADVSLGASSDLVARIRALGGSDVHLAPVAPPRVAPVRRPADVRAEFDLAPGRPLIVCVGRLHTQKAHDVLIHAASRWIDLDPEPLVVIAGDGPLHDTLTGLIEVEQAPVRLLGRRSDVPDLLAAADLVVLTSRWEARPLVVQEAMRLGRAVIATDVGGVRELVGDGAMLVPAGDADALDAAVRSLLGDPGASVALGFRAELVAATWPDEQATNDQIMRVYRSLTAIDC